MARQKAAKPGTFIWPGPRPQATARASNGPLKAELGRLKPVFYQEDIMNGVSRPTTDLSENKATWAVLFLGVYTLLLLLFTNSLLQQL